MKQRTLLLLISTACSILMFLLSGCDSKQAPDPPHAKAALVIELFSALKDKDYQLAEKKIQRLKVIIPDEVFLENINNRLKDNLLISKAQKLLNSGKIDVAINSINEDIDTRGQSVPLVNALKQLRALKDIKQLTDDALRAKNSKAVAISSSKLNKAISSYPSAATLADFSTKRLDYARKLMVAEKALAVEDLKADIDTTWIKNKSYLDTMIASLEAEAPNNSEVLNYKKAMHKNWMNENISDVYDNPDTEFIFFRKALLLKNIAKRNDIYKSLLSLPPNSFKSMLIKIMVLKLTGYSKESSAIAHELSADLAVPAYKSKRWYQLAPDALIGLKNINPFVLYPFFIYYGEDSLN